MKDHDNFDPVHKAVMEHSLPDVVRAFAEGAGVDVVDREGRTALFYASKDGDISIVSELLMRGANVNARDKNLETPLHFATREFRPEVAKILIEGGAKVDAQDIHGNTSLWRAVFESRGRSQMIALLVSAGADENLKNTHEMSPKDLAENIENYDVRQFFN